MFNMLRHAPHRLAFALVTMACAASAAAQPVQVSSTVSGLHIRALSELPPAPAREADESDELFCQNIITQPQTPAGQTVAALGWQVTDEAVAGEYVAVAFFSRGLDGTSGTCYVQDGNVAIYQGTQLQVLVYGDDVSGYDNPGLGRVALTTLPTTWRLESSLPTAPLADLFFDGQSARVQPVAALEYACGAKAPLPNVYEQPIDQARQRLIEHGWRPVPATDDDLFAQNLRSGGIVEANYCSGTGFGFCDLSYDRPDGTVLHVTTIGDDRRVSSYGATCPAGAKK